MQYAYGECQAWFTATEPTTDFVQTPIETSETIHLENICLVDGSWTSTSVFNGYEWKWLDNTRRTQLMGIRNQRRRESALHTEL